MSKAINCFKAYDARGKVPEPLPTTGPIEVRLRE